jgi:NTP pyrophosphatase (non-canonical NTP hydrolase)
MGGDEWKMMDIQELTERMHAFVRSKGWYEPDSKRPQTPRNLAISLSLEANEVLEHFQWGDDLKDKDELGSELADVALYLLQLASVSGIDLEQAILKKLEINAGRTWDMESDDSRRRSTRKE